jgi:hypothetical protein
VEGRAVKLDLESGAYRRLTASLMDSGEDA